MKLPLKFMTWIKSLSLSAKIGIFFATLIVVGGIIIAVVVIALNNNNSETSVSQIMEYDNEEVYSKIEDEEKSDESEKPEDFESNVTSNATSTREGGAGSVLDANSASNSHNAVQNSNSNSGQQQSTQATTPVKTADYNLNMPYYISIWSHRGYYNKCWQTIGDAPANDTESEEWSNKFYSSECRGQEASPVIFGIGRSIAEAGQAVANKANIQYPHYYFALKSLHYEGLLTESYCDKYGLNCDRW